jgi:hypothetical protein
MNWRMIGCCASLAAALFITPMAAASILGSQSLEIDFTRSDDMARKATWSDPDRLTSTARGFGLDAEENACRDGWLQTIPVGIGTSWRPAQSARVKVTLKPARWKVTLPNGQIYDPGGPRMYARHSPDAVHWSDWQPFTHDHDASLKSNTMIFSGELGTPARNREAYAKLREEYAKLDVPWADDEQAMCAWIVKRDPRFFAKHKPFVGYVQFLMEDCFPGGQRIESFSATTTWAVSGLHSVPKDPQAERERSGQDGWSFRGDDDASKPGKAAMDFEFHRQVVPSNLKIRLSPASKVARMKTGLALQLTIANESDRDISTTLSHEWHGGEWPTTGLYAAVTRGTEEDSLRLQPVYLFGEDPQGEGATAIAAGKEKQVELRVDWPGTGSVKTEPLIQNPGKYSVRFALVFKVAGKEQYVVCDLQPVTLAPD